MTPPFIRSCNAACEDPPPQDKRKALILAVLVHLLLLSMLIFGVNWPSENLTPMQVELWADGNSLVSPPPPEPKPEPEPEPERTIPQKPQQEVQRKEQPDPEIAMEATRKKRKAEEKVRLEDIHKQAKLKEKKRLEQEKEAVDKKVKEDVAKKMVAQKKAAEKIEKEKTAADKALRNAFRNDAMGAAGISGGTADRNQNDGGTDSGYGAKVRSCILPGVAYPTPVRSGSENPTVEFRVKLGSDGKVNDLSITSSSGNGSFDRAVETGIRRCNPFPKPSTGRYASYIDVVYRMYD